MNEKGFTLIEIMIVVAIVGILASVAIPIFSQFRIKAFNSVAISDIQNGIRKIETFKSFGSNLPNTIPLFTGPGTVVLTDGVTTQPWLVSNQLSVLYIKGIGGYCLLAKHFSGDTVYMASNASTVPVALNATASQGVKLNGSGATPATLDCSNMTKIAIENIALN